MRLPDELDFRAILTRLESQKEPLTSVQLEDIKLEPNSKGEFRFFMKNHTTGYPYDMLAGMSDDDPLEMWRMLSQTCDPLSREGNFTDS